MRLCDGENVEVYEATNDSLELLLIEVAGLVSGYDGVARPVFEPTIDPDTGRFTYLATVFLYG